MPDRKHAFSWSGIYPEVVEPRFSGGLEGDQRDRLMEMLFENLRREERSRRTKRRSRLQPKREYEQDEILPYWEGM